MKKSNLIFAVIVGLLIFYIGDRATELYYAQNDVSIFDKLNNVSNGIDEIVNDIYIATDKNALVGGGIAIACYAIGILYVISSRHNFMYGKEHGSAEWGTASDIAPLIDKQYDNNILLTQSERISLNTRQTFENDNVLVVGGSGSGKTRFFLKPNLMQMHSSYVVTDPNGLVY
jgi:type IV secretion system protein VirD4